MMTKVVPLIMMIWLVSCQASAPRPNVILILTDDQGYGDLGVYGGTDLITPHLDQMAAEGLRFSNFLMAAHSCSPSRAALLTGCYPQRVGIPHVLSPRARKGLNPAEWTMAEMFQDRGYHTACVGKWHLGHHPGMLPLDHGFDEYLGLPYSNDMGSTNPRKSFPPLPLIKDNHVIETEPDQSQLTKRFTEKALEFIASHRHDPFFLYLAHPMPHVPLAVSKEFENKTGQGLYADVIAEIDDSVGQIFQALKDYEIDENTLVIFTSDNGPWIRYGDHGGSAGPLREGKATVWEGGFRVPCLMRWPKHIPANSLCTRPVMAIDLLPTLAQLCGGRLSDQKIDGVDIWPLMKKPTSDPYPERVFCYYHHSSLLAIRQGAMKLIFPHSYKAVDSQRPGSNGAPAEDKAIHTPLGLYDLESDLGEGQNLYEQYPDVVTRLHQLADQWRQELGDELQQIKGVAQRPPAKLKQGGVTSR